jgi:hypothetical protein
MKSSQNLLKNSPLKVTPQRLEILQTIQKNGSNPRCAFCSKTHPKTACFGQKPPNFCTKKAGRRRFLPASLWRERRASNLTLRHNFGFVRPTEGALSGLCERKIPYGHTPFQSGEPSVSQPLLTRGNWEDCRLIYQQSSRRDPFFRFSVLFFIFSSPLPTRPSLLPVFCFPLGAA